MRQLWRIPQDGLDGVRLPSICHQGSAYEAACAAVPILIHSAGHLRLASGEGGVKGVTQRGMKSRLHGTMYKDDASFRYSNIHSCSVGLTWRAGRYTLAGMVLIPRVEIEQSDDRDE